MHPSGLVLAELYYKRVRSIVCFNSTATALDALHVVRRRGGGGGAARLSGEVGSGHSMGLEAACGALQPSARPDYFGRRPSTSADDESAVYFGALLLWLERSVGRESGWQRVWCGSVEDGACLAETSEFLRCVGVWDSAKRSKLRFSLVLLCRLSLSAAVVI